MEYLEIISLIFNLLCVIFCGLKKKIGWSFGILGCITLGILYTINFIFGQMFLTLIFLGLSIVGRIEWNVEQLEITSNNKSSVYFIFLSIITISIFYLEKEIIDIILVVFSLIANYLLIKRVTQSWIIWSFVNIWSIYFFYQYELYYISFMYSLFFINSTITYFKWKKKLV